MGSKKSKNFATATSNFCLSGIENRKVRLTPSSSSRGGNHGFVWRWEGGGVGLTGVNGCLSDKAPR